MFSRTFFYTLLILCLTAGCGQKRITEEQAQREDDMLAMIMANDSLFEEDDQDMAIEQSLPRNIDETFDDFIFNFARNPHFQLSRITFPLHLNAFGDDFVVNKNEWEYNDLFHGREYYTVFYNEQDDSDYENDPDIETVRFENINLSDSIVRTLHFDRQEGRWKLTRQLLSHLDKHPLASFLHFYHAFATDSTFQATSLCETIKYITTDPDDDFSQLEGTITSDQWPTFAPELPSNDITNIDYGQTVNDKRRIVLLKRGISNGLFDELHFRHTEHGWKLTSYEN